jgi:hypothetical protein
MAQEPSQPNSVVAPSRSKDAIIAAIATILAAVIAAAATIIVNARHEKTNLEAEISTLQGQVDTKTREAKTVAASMVSLQQQVRQLQSTTSSAPTVDTQPNTTSTQPTAAAEPPPPVTRTAREKDLTFGFQRCIRSGSSTTCQFIVTNDGGERMVRLYADFYSRSSRAMDDHGKQQLANGAEIAGVEGTGPEVDLPSKIGVPALIRFSDLPSDVKQFNVLDIVFYPGSGDRYKVEFRDVAIVGAE